MKVTALSIPDIKLIETDVFEDERGFFYESFNQKKFNEAIGMEINFVQDNHSKSKQNVIRGLHLQKEPYAQGKLIRVINGLILDVAVDLRVGSKFYGSYIAEYLSSENKRQLWIPEGFAHGFSVISNYAEVCYKTDKFYNATSEITINPLDEDLGIDWCVNKPFLSTKDKKGIKFKNLKNYE